MKLYDLIEQKFTSGNAVPVERVSITRAEYELAKKDRDASEEMPSPEECAAFQAEMERLEKSEWGVAARAWAYGRRPEGCTLVPVSVAMLRLAMEQLRQIEEEDVGNDPVYSAAYANSFLQDLLEAADRNLGVTHD